MARKIHTTGRPWEDLGGYARAVRIGDLIETSLCSPAGDDGVIKFPGDVYKQTLVSLEVIGQSLRALGMDFKDVISTRIYLADAPRWVEAARAHKEIFADIRPSLGFIYMSGFFHPDIAVEVECRAYRPARGKPAGPAKATQRRRTARPKPRRRRKG
ncbi:MAG: RidA family protein [Alphaproteobacteria bacterium]|nr:RidA family protein [Alphaproteobacteria bacterium]